MIKLLYKLFRKQFNRLAFHEQSKPVGFEKLSFQFIDSEGYKHYAFNDLLDIPIERNQELIKIHNEYTAGISQDEFMRDLEAIEKALNGGESPELAMIWHVVAEWKWRRDNVLNLDTLLELCALFYIAEYEDPNKFDHEVHNKKVEQYRRDYDKGIRVFFCNEELMKLLGIQNMSPEDADKFIQNSKARIDSQKKIIRNFLSEKESLRQSSGSKKSS